MLSTNPPVSRPCFKTDLAEYYSNISRVKELVRTRTETKLVPRGPRHRKDSRHVRCCSQAASGKPPPPPHDCQRAKKWRCRSNAARSFVYPSGPCRRPPLAYRMARGRARPCSRYAMPRTVSILVSLPMQTSKISLMKILTEQGALDRKRGRVQTGQWPEFRWRGPACRFLIPPNPVTCLRRGPALSHSGARRISFFDRYRVALPYPNLSSIPRRYNFSSPCRPASLAHPQFRKRRIRTNRINAAIKHNAPFSN